MALFYILACLLVIAGLALILPDALRAGRAQAESDGQELDQLETNIGIAKERRDSLQRSLDDGMIDQAGFDAELTNLQNALALDLSAEQKQRESRRSGFIIAGVIALFLPIASGALYLKLGTPGGIDSDAMHAQALTQQQQEQQQPKQPAALTELLPNLEKKLEANPEDRDGWKLLGKSYLTIGEFSNAKRALMRAYDLDKDDPDMLAQLAEATAMERGGDLSGDPSDYLDSALVLNPNHQQSLWLKAISVQQAGRHEEAIARFDSLRLGVSGNPDALASIDEMVAQSTQAMGMPITQAAESEDKNQNATASASANASNAAIASLSITVELDDKVKSEVAPDDAVFIFARASSGPPMPLAVSRHTVSELPLIVVLDDTMAMIPDMTLSRFPNVTIGARVSKSGDAIAKPGDWFAEQNNVDVANAGELKLIINQQK